MTQIILMSDSHEAKDAMEIVLKKLPDMDYCIHCGDCLVSPQKMNGFLTVAGNMDRCFPFPSQASLTIDPFHIWIIHGNQFLKGNAPDYPILAKEAKKRGYNMVFFGHTHTYLDQTIDGVRLLNPGSVWKSRDPSEPLSLMKITIDGQQCRTEKIRFVTLLY